MTEQIEEKAEALVKIIEWITQTPNKKRLKSNVGRKEKQNEHSNNGH